MSDLDPSHVARLGVLALFHDIGKFNHGFQAKSGNNRDLWAGHVEPAMSVLDSEAGPWSERLATALDLASLASWSSDAAAIELLAAAISHHGRPAAIPNAAAATLAGWWAPTAARDPFTGLTELSEAAKRWLPEAWHGASQLPADPEFQHGFCGLVQLADWLGSDTEFFPYSVEGDPDRWPLALAAAEHAISAVGLDPTAYRSQLPAQLGFARISNFLPRPMQAAVGTLNLPEAASLTFIEEETGGGKTEAALWHFARLFAAGAVDGLYFALPTRTAATQLHARIVAACERCFPDPANRPAVILAVPGYLAADGARGQTLPGFAVLWNDDPRKADRHRRWAAEGPKRYLAGTVVVGTIDQVLLAALAVDHAHLRATCLLRHLLVIDEVHASDAYMNRLLSELLTRTRAAGGHALLMSATLGTTARDALLRAWGAAESRTTRAQAEAVPYPTLWSVNAAPLAVARTGRDRTVRLATLNADDLEALARQAIAAAQAGARVLIIRNTVRDCLATLTTLESFAAPDLLWRVPTPSGLVSVPHHARYAREDRTYLDRQLELVFGKDATRDHGCIACATQTVQQALDLDADWMLTDLAPVDVLLQRLGRLHRHERPRPAGFLTPQATVLTPPDSLARWLDQPRYGPHGWGNVYEDLRILEATRHLVQAGSWAIPQDNRRLVEAATHPEALAELDPAEPRWATHGHTITGRTITQRDRARLGLLPWHIGFGNDQVCFPPDDLATDIRTRLGEDDRRVELAEPLISPFGQTIYDVTLPARWCHDIPFDADPVVTRNAAFTQIKLGETHFVYDRLGLQRDSKS